MRKTCLSLALTSCLMFLGAAYPVHAEAPLINFVIIQETNLYAKDDQSSRPLGAIAPYQNVQLAPGAPFSFYDKRNPEEWLKVQTWLGDRWIQDDDNVLYGTYEERKSTLKLLNTASLFNEPNINTETTQKLAPQKISSTAKIQYGPKYVINAMSATGQSGTWYQIDTWLGPKWIIKPALMEDVHAEPVDYQLKLMGTETTYSVPYEQEGEGEVLEAGTVHAIAKWQHAPLPANVITWYKISLPQGERWVNPKNDVIIQENLSK
ncbi:hypothetical protein P5G65_07225 [Paenibacillus chondroitinus]|uniref:Uncharacterized protein n=1 Tax=Paenibacillus chondroitinus TaxID=59842 RepID=A0ABU6D888_9BACL|nr:MULTISPECIES: hypothetical protein [Paenibacillus]MCY9661596.1 hypothetical protein [Paenibacillus anseongense]MEB4793681.1 hypothetical protein [Paenibacillus chondroitinus]